MSDFVCIVDEGTKNEDVIEREVWFGGPGKLMRGQIAVKDLVKTIAML